MKNYFKKFVGVSETFYLVVLEFWDKIKPKNWDDQEVPKPERKKVQEGRKHTFWKRFGFFAFATVVFLLVGFFVGVFRDKMLFQLTLAGISGWYFLWKPWREEVFIWKRIGLAGLWLIYIVGVIYLDYFINLFQLAMWSVIVLALIVFITEEVTGKNIYPKWVMYIGLFAVVIFVGLTVNDLFQDHSYYVDQQNITVADFLEQEKSLANLQAHIERKPGDIVKAKELTKRWVFDFLKVHEPAEAGRIKAVTNNFFIIVYILTSLVIFFFIAAPDMLSEWFSGLKKGKGKKEREGVQYPNFFIVERMWDLIQEAFRIWRQKGGRKK